MSQRLSTLLLELQNELIKNGYGQIIFVASNSPAGADPIAQVIGQFPMPISPEFAQRAIRLLMPAALPDAGGQAEAVSSIAFKLAPAVIRSLKDRAKGATILSLMQKLGAEVGVKAVDFIFTKGFFSGFGGGSPKEGN